MKIFLLSTLLLTCLYGQAQPVPGDVFREYVWLPEMAKAVEGRFLRVGGRLGYTVNENEFPKKYHNNGFIPFGHYIRLDEAIKAEVVVEKVGSHEDTKNLRISINGNASITLPDAKAIPKPQADYMHHYNPIVSISLAQLNEGWDNSFKLEVDSVQRWEWPQNLVYGVTLRVYYKTEYMDPKVELIMLDATTELGNSVNLGISDQNVSLRQVDYIGFFEGPNFEGDGIYRQWHYHHFRGKVSHHLGTATQYPYSFEWNTTWLPDQDEPVQIAARIVDNSGAIYFTQALKGLTLKREHQIELCKPYNQPKNWVTREGEFAEKIDIQGNLSKIEAAKLIWTSWSPCYSNGVYINNKKVFEKEELCYEYRAHEVDIEDLSVLKQGENTISTGMTARVNGQLVHGMEVQWPGFMFLIKYKPD